jgi:ketosteroid isomerase-like protein
MKIGERLVELCREGKNMDAINELYDPNVVSVEAAAPPQGQREVRGIDAVRGKNQWWGENHEVHGASTRGPFPHGDDRFCVLFEFDVTNKPSGQRMKMEEVALYTVTNGKISKEEFFYTM